tara:strand:+ start:12491 stop:13117 length:627 start_codon:yes stop_codon:yes gene_type:complete
MVYRNFITRILFSIIIFLGYLLSLLNLNYLFIFGLIIYLLIFYEIYINFSRLKVIAYLYVFISLLSFTLYIYENFNFFIFNTLIFTIVCVDTFSYIFGSLYGKRKIFKIISPKKSLEGYFAGILFTNISFIFFHYIYISTNNFIQNFFLLNLIVIVSILGDLFESLLKRNNNIKDSSNLLPGHGGFFDRFDSFIPSIVLIYIYSSYIL